MLEIHEKDISWLALGQKVSIRVDAVPGQQFFGKIGFIYPTLNPNTRTVRVRVEVANKELILRPGLFGSATLFAKLGKDGFVTVPKLKGAYSCPTHPLERGDIADELCSHCHMTLLKGPEIKGDKSRRVLAVPKNAVLSTGNRHLVYVEWWVKRNHHGATLYDENDDPVLLDSPEYQGFEVILGPLASTWKKRQGKLVKIGNYYPVLSGLPPNVKVVTHAQFLIDSQMELSGKPSLFTFDKGM